MEDGDTVSFELAEATDGQFDPTSTVEAVAGFDWDRVYPLAGPIMVKDAEPGDVLEVEFLELRSVDWGWTAVLPGLGLLSEDFPDAHLHLWDLAAGDAANFLDVADIPIRPFCGVVGVCPDVTEPQSVLPPGHFGGNVDCKDLVVGTKLYLPVTASCASARSRHPCRARPASACTRAAASWPPNSKQRAPPPEPPRTRPGP